MVTLQALALLRRQRIAACKKYKCNTEISNGFYCGQCRRLHQKMCKASTAYHTDNPVDELVGRLAYEFVFDIISFEDLVNANWLGSKKRDAGHTRRLINICNKIVYRTNSCIVPAWVDVEMALHHNRKVLDQF